MDMNPEHNIRYCKQKSETSRLTKNPTTVAISCKCSVLHWIHGWQLSWLASPAPFQAEHGEIWAQYPNPLDSYAMCLLSHFHIKSSYISYSSYSNFPWCWSIHVLLGICVGFHHSLVHPIVFSHVRPVASRTRPHDRERTESRGCRCSPFPHSWGCQHQRESCNQASDTSLPPPKFLQLVVPPRPSRYKLDIVGL